MPGITAVGVGNDLPSGQTGIRRRAAQDESPGGIDVYLGISIPEGIRYRGQDHIVHNFLPKLFDWYIGIMLGGNDHGFDTVRLSVHIFHCDLRFTVRTQVGQNTRSADIGKPPGQLVGKLDGNRHKLRRFIAGIAEHHSLIACAQCLVIVHGVIDTHGDIGRLLVKAAGNTAIVCKTIFRLGVTDAPDHFPGALFIVHFCCCGDLAHNMDCTGFRCDLTGAATHGILFQEGIQDPVRDLVADLVGMPFGDGFRCKIVFFLHLIHSLTVIAPVD